MEFIQVPYKEKKIPAVIESKDAKNLDNKIWFVLTHGAGGDMNTPQLTAVTTSLIKSDFVVFKFTCKGLNIKYRINVYSEMLKFICHKYSPKGIFVGGRSMGARAAVMLTDKEVTMSVFDRIIGIICLSYPLHKVNTTDDLRDGPLKQCHKPLFFLSGTKDEMCKKELLQKVVLSLKVPYKIHWLHDCDHSAKSSDNFKEEKYVEAFLSLVNWCNLICKKQ